MSGYIADSERRNAVIDGFRALADFLESHPAVPVASQKIRIQLSTLGDEDECASVVRAAAAAMGVEVKVGETDLVAGKSFGPIYYYAIAISKARMDEHHAIDRLGRAALEQQRESEVAL